MARVFSNRLVESLRAAAERATAYSERHFRLYALFAFVSPLTSFVDDIVAEPNFDTLAIRTLAVPICAPGFVYHRLSEQARSRFPIYFAIATTFLFPFSFGFMLVMNAAYAEAGTETHIIWILQYVIALFAFTQVLYSPALSSVLWIIGSASALAPLAFIDNPNYEELSRVLVYPLFAYATAVCLGALTNRQKDMIDTERLRAASALGASLAHELRTPLASINLTSSGVLNLLPIIVSGHRKAVEAGIYSSELRKTQLDQLERALTSITNEVKYSNTIIDMLLLNTEHRPRQDTEIFSSTDLINEATSRFPFNNDNEKRRLNCEIATDFVILAPRLLLVHVLFNLLKNALQNVARGRESRIELLASVGVHANTIRIHDNGIGIPAHVLPHIFDRFYTTNKTGQGAGIGLSFCRMVMESIGGKITCESVEGEYTTFTLHFNKVED